MKPGKIKYYFAMYYNVKSITHLFYIQPVFRFDVLPLDKMSIALTWERLPGGYGDGHVWFTECTVSGMAVQTGLVIQPSVEVGLYKVLPILTMLVHTMKAEGPPKHQQTKPVSDFPNRQ